MSRLPCYITCSPKVVLRYDECYWQRCGGPMRVQPLLALLGSALDAPEPSQAATSLVRLNYDNFTRQAVWSELAADTVVAGDIRSVCKYDHLCACTCMKGRASLVRV